MTTCEPVPDGGETEPLTLFAADSLASPSPSRGRGSRRRIAGGSGQRSQASFATYDPGSSSWRTFQDCLDGASETFSETWPASGMTRNGTAYRRPSSVPPIYATESGLLPTPSAVSYGTNQGGGMGRVGPARPSLETMARHDLWPTPQAHDARPGHPERVGRHETKHGGRDLTDWVARWPTPAARDHKGPGLPSRQGGQDLPTAVRRWPTPVASDTGTDRGSSAGWGLRNAVGGLLNPTWVEWLMGYPAGWTDCED